MDRRYKIAYVDQQTIMDVILQKQKFINGINCFPKLNLLDVPDDALLQFAYYNPTRMCFEFIIRHHSWPVVPPAEFPQIIETRSEVVYVDTHGNIIEERKFFL